jgi:type III secretion protein N (ATPase)
MASAIADGLRDVVSSTRTLAERGRVVRAVGTLLRVSGISARIGQQCRISDASGLALRAEVVGLVEGDALLVPLGSLEGVAADARVEIVGERPEVGFGPGLLGRVLDAHGQPLDGRPLPAGLQRQPLNAPAPPALQRSPVRLALPTGVRAIDGLLTVGVGQRMGILAAAGAGKSTLMGMLARSTRCDAVVIGLIGERGREVGEFIEDILGEAGLARAVVVVATSDRPALERVRAARAATALAEGFRAQGLHVLLLVDSVTRWARALREIGLAVGEPPVRRGYPPSVYAELPRLFERAGHGRLGSITAFYTVLEEDEDGSDPLGEEVRSILDGHIVLSRELAGAGHHPAIDVQASSSRVFSHVASPEHLAWAGRVRALVARRGEIRFLLQAGEYRAGSDALADEALARWPRIEGWLRQAVDHVEPFECALQSLREIVT